MVSPATPYVRPPSSSSALSKKQAQGPRRPSPLNLNTAKTVFNSQSTIKAVRGSVCWSEEGTEVPLIMELGVGSNRSTPGHSSAKASGILGARPYELTDMNLSRNLSVREEDDLDRRPVSPQRSLRTIIDLDSPLGSDEESDISPISEDRPLANSSKVLARFFPELTGNFAVMPPDGVEPKPKFRKGRLRIEDEIGERVQSLYQNSSHNTSQRALRVDHHAGTETETTISSDHERQSSTTSLDEGKKDNWKMDSLSKGSPPTGGFDDEASVHSVGIATQVQVPMSRLSAKPTPTRLDSKASKISKASLQDLRYKPLPRAPVMEPDMPDSYLKPISSRGHSASNCADCTAHRPHVPHSVYATTRHNQSSRCQSCGHGQSPNHRERANRSDHKHQHHGVQRNGSTWRHATDELEITYIDDGRSGRRVLVLDGPLQISRNNHGDLVAARPAPLPPTTKPYSESPASLELLRKEARRMGSSTSLRESVTKKKGHKYTRSKDSNESMRDSKPSKTKEETKGGRWSGGNSKSNESSKGSDLQKLKKSFSIARPTFHRSKPNTRTDQRRFSRLSTLSSRSDTAVDPQADQTNSDEETRRLSRHLSLSHPNLEVVPIEDDDSGSNKREDLLLQLPRLQTDNLSFKHLLEQFAPGYQSPLTNPTSIPRPNEEDTRDAKEVFISKLSTPQAQIQPNDDKIVVETPLMHPPQTMRPSQKMRQSTAFVSTSKASSVYLRNELVYELAAGPPSPAMPMPPPLPMSHANGGKQNFRINFPIDEIRDSFVELLLERMPSLDDLFNLALANRRFYRLFKQRELFLIKNALFKMSRPAWELREMSPPWTTEWQLVLDPDSQVPEYTGKLYLDRYAQDIFILAQLKSMVLMRCAPFLRPDTVRGLAGLDDERAEEVDNAFWRVWTFCRIFGSGKGRENDIEGQMDWLRGGKKARTFHGASSAMMTEPYGMNNVLFEPPEGFARGNCGGLTATELYDMTEIWNCLNVLVQPLHGKCIEARRAGIFNGMHVPENDPVREETVLEEWTSWVLTLGMSAVIAVCSLTPSETPAMIFQRAKDLGLTKWDLPETRMTRQSFMKEAVSRVYEDQERSMILPSGSADSPCELPSDEIPTRGEDNERRQALSLEIRMQRTRGAELPDSGNTFATERPMSTFSTILGNLVGTGKSSAPPVPPVPGLASDRSSTSTDGNSPAIPGTPSNGLDHLTPTPAQHPHYKLSAHNLNITSDPFTRPRSPPMSHYLSPPLPPQVQDPVDRAICRMVNELGFNEDDVKWALKITDTGEGLNVEAAEQLLHQQKKKSERNPFVTRGKNSNGKNSLLMSVIKQQGGQESGWRWA
ncbi:hypothetical protein N7488_002325 [Penicillium malachiteum]|nr:hypothetical protein N7488_002325 [Penicillium malachiteum]